MIGDRRVLAVIPARGGSKGVPGKNIQPVGGRPLIAWTVSAAMASRYVDRVILSSDDADIIDAARAAGCEAPFVRPDVLATDEATSVDVVLDALERVPGYDIVVLLQPTSPLRTAEDIDGALERMAESGAPGCVSVCQATDHPWLTFGEDGAGRLQAFCSPGAGASLRRQDLPPAYVLNGAVYAVDTAGLRATGRFLEPGLTAAWVMPTERSLDIDTWDDIRAADAVLSAGAAVR